jgi:hypothetical protein
MSNQQLCEELIIYYEKEIAFLTTHNEYLHYSIKRCIDTLKRYDCDLQNNFIMDNENIFKENNKRLDGFNVALKGLKAIDDINLK